MRKLFLHLLFVICSLATQDPVSLSQRDGRTVSPETFRSLEELARIVDISYCVGSTGISKPFQCLSRCKDFEGFELVNTWNTGVLLSDSCGYIAISHAPYEKRVIVAFRGTYSIANTIADLSTVPAEYTPFPAPGHDDDEHSICAQHSNTENTVPRSIPRARKDPEGLRENKPAETCANCTVHSGFLKSWRNTRCTVLPDIELSLDRYPDYQLTLVGHSLGGAVAALAGLELEARGWRPLVTTFGEPRIGNQALNDFIDQRFNLNASNPDHARYRRVTHVDDPVPLLPLEEWGYRMHAGEIFISKSSLPPTRDDVEHCSGAHDPRCIEEGNAKSALKKVKVTEADVTEDGIWTVPKRYRLWQLFFAHRDYFWRLGLCVPGGDPWDWRRPKYGMDGDADADADADDANGVDDDDEL